METTFPASGAVAQDTARGVVIVTPEPSAAEPIGLNGAEARRRLAEFGPNAVAEEAPPAWRTFLGKF